MARHFRHYQYFGHVLELTLQHTLEGPDEQTDQLSETISFLDHFPESIDVIANVARKTEVQGWDRLFAVAGHPRDLYQVSLPPVVNAAGTTHSFVTTDLHRSFATEAGDGISISAHHAQSG